MRGVPWKSFSFSFSKPSENENENEKVGRRGARSDLRPSPWLGILLALVLLAGCVSKERPPEVREPRRAEAARQAEAAFAASLDFAREERPNLDVGAARRRLEALTREVGAEAGGAWQPTVEKADAVARVFFGRRNFAADPDDQDGRRTETFDVPLVLEREQGACLPVAIVIARACSGAGIAAAVVRAPGHALVALGPPEDRLYLDPAERGAARDWLAVAQARPYSPKATHLYSGKPMSAAEVAAQLRANRAAFFFEQGKLDRAEADARAALADVPDLPEALVNLAAVKLRKKQVGEADEGLERAHRMLPDHPAILFNLGLAAAARGDAEAAKNWYRRALEVAPGMLKARENLRALDPGAAAPPTPAAEAPAKPAPRTPAAKQPAPKPPAAASPPPQQK